MSDITDYVISNNLTLNTGNLLEAVLVTDIDAGDETATIRVRVEEGITLIEPPFLALLTRSRGVEDMKLGEIVLFTAVSESDPDEFSIRRFTSQGYLTESHLQGELILLNVFSEHLEVYNDMLAEATTLNSVIKKFLRHAFGTGNNLVIRTTFDPTTDGLVAGTGVEGTVNAFIGFANSETIDFPGWLIHYVPNASAETSDDESTTIKLPLSPQKRTDLIEVNSAGEIVITKGTPDSTNYPAPAATAGRIVLGELVVNSTAIFSVNDRREFY
jgi:hypothetical protein